jgi:predicted amidohydrolase
MTGFTIAAAQSRSVKGDIAKNVQRHAEFVRLAKEHGADVIVFPELSLTGYEPTIAAETAVEANDGVLEPLKKLANETGAVVLAGCPLRSVEERPYIGMLIFQPGETVAVYRKRFVHASEEPFFVAGEETVVFAARGMAIGAAICADISNPQHPSDAAGHGANVYAASVAKTQQEIDAAAANMAAHAKKHGILALLANYASATGGYPTCGRSAAWDESGQLVAMAEAGECLVVVRKTAAGWQGGVVGV